MNKPNKYSVVRAPGGQRRGEKDTNMSTRGFASALLFILLLLRPCDPVVSPSQQTPEEARSDVRGQGRQQHRHPKPPRRRCGGPDHVALTRPCLMNDSYCGEWNSRKMFHPLSCDYEDISGAQARKCLGSRTIAFIGDSMIRDICIGVVNLLSGIEVPFEMSETKFDHERLNTETNISLRIADFKNWKHNVPAHNYNGHIFPIPGKTKYDWQVQMWSLYRNEFIDGGQVDDILSNKLMIENKDLHRIDVAFWNHGLHDWGWWEKPPIGDRYFETIMDRWIRSRAKTDIPTVWVSMNPNCRKKIKFAVGDMDRQAAMVEEGNRVANERTAQAKLPYWDAAAALRTPTRCEQSADGVHVKMYVDQIRAKMLFNHLCDHNGHWRGISGFG